MPVLRYMGSMTVPNKEVIRTETLALQTVTAGPTIASTAKKCIGKELGLCVDVVGIHITHWRPSCSATISVRCYHH